MELDALLKAAGVAGATEYAIYSPPSSRAVIEQFPAEFLARLRVLDRKVVAKLWATAMSTPERTHSVTGVKLSDGWEVSEAEAILNLIAALAHRASAGQQLYLLTEA